MAPIGSPPMIRLIMIGLAVPPDPAIAPSTQVLPVALNALANSATAAASPPEVHQCVTSRSVADATLTVPVNSAVATRAVFLKLLSNISFSPIYI